MKKWQWMRENIKITTNGNDCASSIESNKSNGSNHAVVDFITADKNECQGQMIRRAAEKALDDNYSLTIKIDTLQGKFKKMKELCDKLTE